MRQTSDHCKCLHNKNWSGHMRGTHGAGGASPIAAATAAAGAWVEHLPSITGETASGVHCLFLSLDFNDSLMRDDARR